MIWQLKPSLVAVSVLLLSACSNQLNPTERAQDIANTPELWQQATTSALKVEDNWLQQLENPQVFFLVEQALANNQQILQSGYDVAIKQQQLIATGAALWPSLDLSARTNRSKDNRPVSYNNASSANLTLSYEIDLWVSYLMQSVKLTLNF